MVVYLRTLPDISPDPFVTVTMPVLLIEILGAGTVYVTVSVATGDVPPRYTHIALITVPLFTGTFPLVYLVLAVVGVLPLIV